MSHVVKESTLAQPIELTEAEIETVAGGFGSPERCEHIPLALIKIIMNSRLPPQAVLALRAENRCQALRHT